MPSSAIVKVDKTKKVTTEQLIAAVKAAGYGATAKAAAPAGK